MKLHRLRLSNFQSFGPEPTAITFDDLTFLIGPNGSGKTTVLQALCRLFSFDPGLRRVQRSDFHVPVDEAPEASPEERAFWIEAEFAFPELKDAVGKHPTIPPHFAHMRLDDADSVPRVRFRLDAKLDSDGEIEDVLSYVLDVDDNDEPLTKHPVPRPERNNIHVHYLPARRDPSEHIAYTANSLLGRALRSINWKVERDTVKDLTSQISDVLAKNSAVEALGVTLSDLWKGLHKGSFFADPKVTFVSSEIEALLRHLSISFSPAHGDDFVDFSRLSDGQKSMLYLSLVLSTQAIGRAVLSEEDKSFDIDKLKPAVFTLVSMEEPENSLSPHYLGRVVSALTKLSAQDDAQALIATHAPSMLRRVAPESIRYLRLNEKRSTQVSTILMPPKQEEAYKFVREAVQAFPELYFSRLVVLGEGDSEEIVLPRLFKATGLAIDESAISVVPLGGRHVNHFWRLLHCLGIPHLTLLDLDLARHQGGWGRLKYANDQLGKYSPGKQLPSEWAIPKWNDAKHKVLEYDHYIEAFEERGIYFSSPLDLDFTMINAFGQAYGIDDDDREEPQADDIKAVLGDSYHGIENYAGDEQELFRAYHKIFKVGSKPAAHLGALATLTDTELKKGMPASLARLVDAVKSTLEKLPE